MVGPITLTKDFIDAANEFLCGGECDGTAPGKKPFFTASDVTAELVDQYSLSTGDTRDPRSWLGNVSDGRIGVRTTDTDGNITERLIVHSGNAGAQSCPADVATTCAVPQAITQYDPARVAAFFAATFGFAGLHEGKAKDRVPGQMQVLREATRAGRIMLDEALTKFGALTTAPEEILITKELRGKINAFLNEGRKPADVTEFLTVDDENKYLVHQDPTAKNKSRLTGDGNGIIGVMLGTNDAPVEKLLIHTGNFGQFTCEKDYVTCTAQAGGTFPKERVLMLQAALFGFASLYDTQLLENFEKGGAKERALRVKLDEAFALFTVDRNPAIEAPTAPSSVEPEPPVAVSPPPVEEAPVAPPPPVEVEAAPAERIPPPTAETPAAPVVDPEPTAPPTTTADDEENPLMVYVADAVGHMREYGRQIIDNFWNFEPAAPTTPGAPTVTYEPLMSPAKAVTVGASTWAGLTVVDSSVTASRVLRAGQQVNARAVWMGGPGRIPGAIKGVGLRSVGYGVFGIATAVGLALIPIEQSEIPLTVQGDLPADE